MYYLNKLVGAVLNPISLTLLLAVAGLILSVRGRRRTGRALVVASVLWLYFWSTPLVCCWLGCSLEGDWPVTRTEDAPPADAIVILGGGMGSNTNVYPYAEMWSGADRVWHAARLYRAGKAPLVIPTGSGERESTVPLLRDFGVPEQAIVVEDAARNTEENAKFVVRVLKERGGGRRVLLVTSAWHMRRARLMFEKYAPGLETIPAATDYEATVRAGSGFSLADFLPTADCLQANTIFFKEYVGYVGYRLLR